MLSCGVTNGKPKWADGCIAHWRYNIELAQEDGNHTHAAWLLQFERFARLQQRELGKNKAPTYAWLP
jgi:hypothetical protein